MNESKNVRKNVSMMLTGMVIGAALTGGSIAVAAGITAEPTWQPIFVDGQQVEMEAYNIAGHNYVKLRDMGKQVGFNVYWNAGVQIDTGHPYTGIAPAASGIRVSSYKGSTLRPGDRSGLNISPSADIKSVVSTQPNVIRVENTSGFWTAIAVSSGTSDVVVTDQHGKTAALTLTVVDGKQGASIPESGTRRGTAGDRPAGQSGAPGKRCAGADGQRGSDGRGAALRIPACRIPPEQGGVRGGSGLRVSPWIWIEHHRIRKCARL